MSLHSQGLNVFQTTDWLIDWDAWLQLMPAEIAQSAGEPADDAAASQIFSLLIAEIIANVSEAGGFVIHQ